jgi:SOS-response transcriptional repressor LexA
VVKGDSMEPESMKGDIVTVDPGRSPISGNYVIAKNGHEATFKQLIIDGNNVYLKPLNTRYPIKDITGIEIKIVGVVVEKRKRY